MSLDSLAPDPTWDAAAHPETVTFFEELPSEAVIHVWGGDWCGDCRRELPALAAALAAADFADDRILVHEVDHDKDGSLVGDYDVTVVPTVVIEVGGEELARFEERERFPAPVALARAADEDAGTVT